MNQTMINFSPFIQLSPPIDDHTLNGMLAAILPRANLNPIRNVLGIATTNANRFIWDQNKYTLSFEMMYLDWVASNGHSGFQSEMQSLTAQLGVQWIEQNLAVSYSTLKRKILQSHDPLKVVPKIKDDELKWDIIESVASDEFSRFFDRLLKNDFRLASSIHLPLINWINIGMTEREQYRIS